MRLSSGAKRAWVSRLSAIFCHGDPSPKSPLFRPLAAGLFLSAFGHNLGIAVPAVDHAALVRHKGDLGVPAASRAHGPVQGLAALSGPAFQRVRTLRGGPMEELAATGSESKGFLIRVSNSQNDHLMFANRILGSSTSSTTTKTGKPRWRNAAGNVEKAYDVNRIGASSQQRAVWQRGVDATAAENLERFIEQRIKQVLAAAK